LDHMSLHHWTKCHIFIGPRGMTTIHHVSFFTRAHVMLCMSACLFLSGPRITPWTSHASFFDSTTWQDGFVPRVGFVLAQVSYPGSYTCHSLICPRVRFYLTTWPMPHLPHAEQSLHQKNDFRSTLLHKMTTCVIILNLNQITVVQISSKPLTEFTYQGATKVHIKIANKPHMFTTSTRLRVTSA
jgi:hypothetical protein